MNFHKRHLSQYGSVPPVSTLHFYGNIDNYLNTVENQTGKKLRGLINFFFNCAITELVTLQLNVI